jgi:2,3,4,5-tetrahydropyridine-2-carboxylate N-succinyltransferase
LSHFRRRGLGGVLEPLQASPTIIEDNCFIGARAEVAEGVIVGEGSVLSMGVYLSAPPKCRPRQRRSASGQGAALFRGGVRFAAIRQWSQSYCAVIVKTVDEKTRAKTSINELAAGL